MLRHQNGNFISHEGDVFKMVKKKKELAKKLWCVLLSMDIFIKPNQMQRFSAAGFICSKREPADDSLSFAVFRKSITTVCVSAVML